MSTTVHQPLSEIEPRVLDAVSEQLGIARHKLKSSDRLIQDLHCDSLDLVELIMTLEETFQVTFPDDPQCAVYKAIFTRQPFRLADLAELVYLQQGTGTPSRKGWRSPAKSVLVDKLPFTQLDGKWHLTPASSLLEPLGNVGTCRQFRRQSDGMRCVEIASAEVEIGSDNSSGFSDEQPQHIVGLDSYLIDAEPVSTTAYCRFLNSIGEVAHATLTDWFMLSPDDDRIAHLLVEYSNNAWKPIVGAERQPMILVSWYGANSYSLWANGRDWQIYFDESHEGSNSWLPSEAQWEYAARGRKAQAFPWGDAEPTQENARFGQHSRAQTYDAGVLPMANVNEKLGMSPFGLHHVAGNVWQWCQDWYDAEFYCRAEASVRNSVNRRPTQVRSERGGSWVGPAELCRSSHRRGRPPLARGRCLGFRCVTPVSEIR